MLTLFVRAILLYFMVFLVIRLTGKRQVSDLQPFDLVVTLLIADVASEPVTDTSIPLLYGIIPMFALYFVQQLFSVLSLKNERIRSVVCGKPLVIIAKGIVQEDMMRKARYSLNDLLEQLRDKDVFDLANVEYAILETNGSISILQKGENQVPKMKDLQLPVPNVDLTSMLILDGEVHQRALQESGHTVDWLRMYLKKMGFSSEKEVFFASLNADGMLHTQEKMKYGGKAHFMSTRGTNNG